MEAAMAASADKYRFKVIWQPFLLRPDMPREGIQKAPNTPDNPRVGARLKDAGKAVGIDFSGKCDWYPNTLQAHAVLGYSRFAGGERTQNEFAELLFQAYFTDGLVPVGDVLLDLAQKCGLDRDAVDKVIHSESRLKALREDALKWSAKGVSGVPYFYMNGQKTFSGAQAVERFLQTFDFISERFPLQPSAPLPPNKNE